jgi:hypothetical protein
MMILLEHQVFVRVQFDNGVLPQQAVAEEDGGGMPSPLCSFARFRMVQRDFIF